MLAGLINSQFPFFWFILHVVDLVGKIGYVCRFLFFFATFVTKNSCIDKNAAYAFFF